MTSQRRSDTGSDKPANDTDRPQPVPDTQHRSEAAQHSTTERELRLIEVAHLNSDGTPLFSLHRVPANALFSDLAAACAHGTLVQGVHGPVAVEDLLPGDLIVTSRGPQPVQWIGSMTVAQGATGARVSGPVSLTRILADTFGPARPSVDVLLGPAARIKYLPRQRGSEGRSEGALCTVRDFADGAGIFEVTPPSPVTLYHLAFRNHATFTASGLTLESFHPGPDLQERLGPTARRLFLSLFPHLETWEDFGPLALPRVSRDQLGGMSAA